MNDDRERQDVPFLSAYPDGGIRNVTEHISWHGEVLLSGFLKAFLKAKATGRQAIAEPRGRIIQYRNGVSTQS